MAALADPVAPPALALFSALPCQTRPCAGRRRRTRNVHSPHPAIVLIAPMLSYQAYDVVAALPLFNFFPCRLHIGTCVHDCSLMYSVICNLPVNQLECCFRVYLCIACIRLQWRGVDDLAGFLTPWRSHDGGFLGRL